MCGSFHICNSYSFIYYSFYVNKILCMRFWRFMYRGLVELPRGPRFARSLRHPLIPHFNYKHNYTSLCRTLLLSKLIANLLILFCTRACTVDPFTQQRTIHYPLARRARAHEHTHITYPSTGGGGARLRQARIGRAQVGAQAHAICDLSS